MSTATEREGTGSTIRLTAQVACAGCAAKLAPGDLRQALQGLPPARRDRRVLVDQTTLDDAGVFAYRPGEAWVQTVDFFTPIVDDPYDYGQVAAANSVSDVYAMGAKPLTALAVLCFPEQGLPPEVLREILRGGRDKMTEAGVSVLGGHSVRDPEIKFGYAVTGVVRRKRMLTNAGARPGDVLVLTKPLGTGVLATALKRGQLDPPVTRKLTRSMATLNRAASEAAVEFGARAATDVTGFSLLGHGQQMADQSGVTLRLEPRSAWFLPRVLELLAKGVKPGGLTSNRTFYEPGVESDGVDPAIVEALYDPQTSGGLLIAVPARRAAGLRSALKRRRVWNETVGEVVRRGRTAVVLAPPGRGKRPLLMCRERMGPGGSRGLQILRSGASSVRGGFDSHAFPPMFRITGALLIASTLLIPGMTPARAAEPDPPKTAEVGSGTVTGDTVLPSPDAPRPWYQQPGWIGARSIVIPGWGQASNGAWIKAAVVAAAEVTMIVKLVDDERDLNELQEQIEAAPDFETEDALILAYNERLNAQTSHRWWLGGIVLVSVVDAYVDAHFRGFKVKFDRDPALEGGTKSERISMYYRWTF